MEPQTNRDVQSASAGVATAIDRRRVRTEFWYLGKAAERRRRRANVLVLVSAAAVISLTAFFYHVLLAP